jgi:tRNA (guanine37-N1)-methyltransferase
MRIDIITAFPKIIQDPLNESILKLARKRIDLFINILDLRNFSTDKHRTIDDAPYGGGPGMILKPAPVFKALEDIFKDNVNRTEAKIVYPSPQGKIFTQTIAEELNRFNHLVFICGHYKAVDQRIIDEWVTDEISVGDFILSGGEIPTLLIIDAIVRLKPGVLGDMESARTDSFQNDLLDCPYYTRPEDFFGLKVPEVLLSGNHKEIEEWRLKKKIEKTKLIRPDLYKKYLTAENKRQSVKEKRKK